MAEAPSIEEIIYNATFTVASKYAHSENSDELKSTVSDLLSFHDLPLRICDVRGTSEDFKAVIKAKVNSCEKVNEFVNSYCNHNNESLKVANSR